MMMLHREAISHQNLISAGVYILYYGTLLVNVRRGGGVNLNLFELIYVETFETPQI